VIREESPKSQFYNVLNDWLGPGLLLSSGARWRSRRKLLTPAFHYDILRGFHHIFVEHTLTLCNKWEKLSDSTLDICPYISALTLDTVCTTSMGIDIHSQDDSDSPYFKAVHEAAYIANLRMMKPWLQSEYIFALTPHGRRLGSTLRVLHQFTEGVIRARRQALSESLAELSSKMQDRTARKYMPLLDVLLASKDEETGAALTDYDIRCEIDTFAFEGHDTSAAGLQWCLYFLAKHPEWQQKARQEIKDVVGSHTEPSMEHLNKLEVITAIIKETLRLRPPVPYIARVADKDMNVKGYTIPKGSQLVVSPHILHHNPSVWKDPYTFDPNRFAHDKVELLEPFAYIPFSAGPRNCIGQKFAMDEMKVILTMILSRFKLELPSLSGLEKEPVQYPDIILRPKDGIYLRVLNLSS